MSKTNRYQVFSFVTVLILITTGCGGSKKDSVKAPTPQNVKAVSQGVAAKKTSASAAENKAVPKDVKTKETSAKTSLSKEKYGRNDPFALNVTKKQSFSEPTGLNLQGIVFDTEAPNAIVNNQIVGVGANIAGNTIVKINENSVIFNDGTENFEVRLTSKKSQ